MAEENKDNKPKTDAEKFKDGVNSINAFIEKHSLKKIMILTGFVFFSLIMYKHLSPTIGYDCSDKGEEIVKQIYACEQQRIDEDLNKRQLAIEELRVKKESDLAKLVEELKVINYQDSEQVMALINRQTLMMEKSFKELARMRTPCDEIVVKSMCQIVRKY